MAALQGTASSRPAGSMTIIHKADRRKGAAPARAAALEMDRMVANCLCCGKIYDCRESSSNDVRSFVGERSSAVICPVGCMPPAPQPLVGVIITH